MNELVNFADILGTVNGRSAYKRAMAESLASVVTGLLNENEPLLKATCEGTEITVTEKGGPLVFSITVETAEQAVNHNEK